MKRFDKRSLPGAGRLLLQLVLTLPLFASPHAYGRSEGPTDPRAPRMKTIGVVGIAPLATADFEERLHRASQRRLKQHANSGYPPMIVYHHRRPPFVVGDDGMIPVIPLQLDPDLRTAAARLGPMVDFLVIVANGPHLLVGDVERAAGRPVLSMVDRAVDEVRRRNWKRVGVLTMAGPTVYTKPLDALGVSYETLGEQQQTELNRVMFGVMEGRIDEPARRIAQDALSALRRRGVDGVILGCTELPVLLEPEGSASDLIDPVELLADAALELALQ